ncbi:hypothetical protein NEUTE1DRAFT_127651 [Neurospora tetrasperma FGSC 2508]|uniref:Zn(2)-C6 fungal-type domain-containing protein n=1 Tax=Neurospora tetrasperma (strain FGSC 2508 / ATCC MYA-4615 / P0657) TaxID=510951 RepID=F8MEU6_NEUT8|nr:uncharacterized protein NEUTE1DRAFT_127651 [Neurospora tetrasperma FGSC 2508]EGO60870.1 hypothetical protein NEUTE1DRAFT_127651 [Neurospora tetrasperma FGSC 2508]
MGPSRDACDRCHTMKTRCQRTPQTRECVRCNRLGISCTYSPPGRTGRPLGARKGGSEKGKKEAAERSRKGGRSSPMVKTHMSASLGIPTPGLDHSLQMMPDGNSGVNPSLLGDFDLFSASAYQAELDYLSFPFMDSFLAESAGDLTFALSSAMDSQPSYSSGSSSPPGSSSPRTPATPHQQSFQPFSGHDQRAWSVNNTDSSSDPGSPSSLFTENIFSPSFIPKPPRNQYFPSDERSDNGEGDGEILVRLLDLQARISKLVKHLNGGRGSAIDCEEVLNAGKSLISLLDSVGAPSRFFSSSSSSPFSDSRMSEPASPMFSSSSRSTSSSTSSALLSLENTIPSNVLILSLSSCYATLLHAYDLLANRLHHHQQQHSHSHCQKYVSGIQTPLLSPASSISSFSPIEQQQGYFFSNGLRHQAQQPLDGNNAHLHAMAQMVQKLKHTLQRCMGRLGQGSSGSNGALGAKKKKKQNPNVHLDVESCCNAGDDDLLMSLSKPALLEMGWGEEELWQGMNW